MKPINLKALDGAEHHHLTRYSYILGQYQAILKIKESIDSVRDSGVITSRQVLANVDKSRRFLQQGIDSLNRELITLHDFVLEHGGDYLA